jgi:hypothetical protein
MASFTLIMQQNLYSLRHACCPDHSAAVIRTETGFTTGHQSVKHWGVFNCWPAAAGRSLSACLHLLTGRQLRVTQRSHTLPKMTSAIQRRLMQSSHCSGPSRLLLLLLLLDNSSPHRIRTSMSETASTCSHTRLCIRFVYASNLMLL